MQKHISLLTMLTALFLGSGCGGTQPLLTMLSQEQPVRAGSGSWWQYQGLGSQVSFTRTMVASGSNWGKETVSVTLTVPQTGPAGRYSGTLAQEGNGLYLFDLSPSPGQWRLERKLPYIVGASWDLEASAGEDSKKMKVDGIETLIIPAGTFERVFRIIETTQDADAIPEKIERVIWVMPTVGDLQYASIDASGTMTVEHQLSQYFLAP